MTAPAASRIFRPAATAAVVVLAVLRPPVFPPDHRLFIIAGLVLSLVGDLLEALPRMKFPAGPAACLVARLLYAAGIWRTMAGRMEMAIALPILIGAFFVLRALFPHLGSMKAPVTLRVLAVTVLLCLAGQRYVDIGGTAALCAVVGAIFLGASDLVFGFDRFVKKIPFARIIVPGTYFIAQILIALSV